MITFVPELQGRVMEKYRNKRFFKLQVKLRTKRKYVSVMDKAAFTLSSNVIRVYDR